MSFRRFIYYCALCGAWAAFIGWIPGRIASISDDHALLRQGVKAMLLGLAVALALGLVDAIWNVPFSQLQTIGLRVFTAIVIASLGAFVSGLVGEFMRVEVSGNRFLEAVFWVVAWTITGTIIGASLGAFETAMSLVRQENLRGAVRKITSGILGGAVGGFLGGALSLALRFVWTSLVSYKAEDALLSPSSWGFVVLGLCIGLMIGLAQVVLKEAWLKVESGFRAGRELMLTKDETTIGRAETCDLGLFGDNTIAKLHARIQRENSHYVLVDEATEAGTYVNDERVTAPVALRAGDAIRVGRSLLRFGERQKRSEPRP
jgi:hypothetical protein